MKPGCEKTVRDCINYRLGPSIVELTKLNSNSQKVESLNNVIRHSLPKMSHILKKFQAELTVQCLNVTMVQENLY